MIVDNWLDREVTRKLLLISEIFTAYGKQVMKVIIYLNFKQISY